MKELFLLDPDITFLNHGSFGATPRPVFESYQRWQRELECQPVEFLGRRSDELLNFARAKLADYLGTSRDNLVFVTNATLGVNIMARSLALGSGDEVLASNHEYGALDRTWGFLSQQSGFKYINQRVSLPVKSVDQWVQEFWDAVNPNTRVIFLSHITSPTAMIFPVEEICRRARQQGILTVIDGAHAPGQLDLALGTLGADFYTGNLHKWLCAPKGAAFLYARSEVQHLVQPLIVSWGWQSDNPGPSPFIDWQQWTGTRDISAFLAVPDAIDFQAAHNWRAVRESCHALASDLRQRVTALTGLEALYPDSPRWYRQMGTVPLPSSVDINDLKIKLYDGYKIEVPLIDWNGYKLIRFSLQAYNSAEDVLALEQALKTLLPGKHNFTVSSSKEGTSWKK